ncbi:hypothetical protein SAMN04487769_1290 [Burkholderia sp. b14]|nr:hypothetical protein SAMN04487769_1290 [Burkholderia sp. b14]
MNKAGKILRGATALRCQLFASLTVLRHALAHLRKQRGLAVPGDGRCPGRRNQT